MTSYRDIAVSVIWSLFLVLCFQMTLNAQNGNREESGGYLEGELLDRARKFALEEYNRAVKFGAEAREIQPPSNRKSYYIRMHEPLEGAVQLFEAMEEKPEAYQQIPDLLTKLWAEEYNAGVEILKDEEVRHTTENPAERAKAHLENAITIQPDSAITYVALSSLLLRQFGDTTGAITAYEQALERMELPETRDFTELLELYFMQNRYAEVIRRAREAKELYPNEVTFIQYLADAYLQLGESESVMTLIRELIKKEPDNPRYYFILGSLSHELSLQFHEEARTGRQHIERLEDRLQQSDDFERRDLRQRIDSLRVEAEKKEKEEERLLETAMRELAIAGELDPENEEVFRRLGVMYQNKAVEFIEMRDNAKGQAQAMEYDERAITTLTRAMENYEKAVGLNPGNMKYWEILSGIYSELGMIRKAEQALDKIED